MKKTTLIIFAFVALVGMFTCVLVEPALAATSDVHCSDVAGDDYCLFSCHTTHHFAVFSANPNQSTQLLQSRKSFRYSEVFFLDEPISSIFRPPMTA